jgi:hypothetical protein
MYYEQSAKKGRFRDHLERQTDAHQDDIEPDKEPRQPAGIPGTQYDLHLIIHITLALVIFTEKSIGWLPYTRVRRIQPSS